MSIRFAGYAAAVVSGKPDAAFVKDVDDPSQVRKFSRMTRQVDSCPIISAQNTLAIRRQLYVDAFALLPHANIFGIGMDNFVNHTCIVDHNVHNSFLQAVVEFGWPAGMLLAAMTVATLAALWPMARSRPEARFVLCSLIFVIVISMGHGRISRDGSLFLLLGYAASFRDQRNTHPK